MAKRWAARLATTSAPTGAVASPPHLPCKSPAHRVMSGWQVSHIVCGRSVRIASAEEKCTAQYAGIDDNFDVRRDGGRVSSRS